MELVKNQPLRDKIYDEIYDWLLKGYNYSDSYKIVKLVSIILEIVDKELEKNNE